MRRAVRTRAADLCPRFVQIAESACAIIVINFPSCRPHGGPGRADPRVMTMPGWCKCECGRENGARPAGRAGPAAGGRILSVSCATTYSVLSVLWIFGDGAGLRGYLSAAWKELPGLTIPRPLSCRRRPKRAAFRNRNATPYQSICTVRDTVLSGVRLKRQRHNHLRVIYKDR